MTEVNYIRETAGMFGDSGSDLWIMTINEPYVLG